MSSETLPRTCGSCTACCKPIAIPELEKPAGKWCQHCDIGKGCTIYPFRPISCQEFRCEWLKGFGAEEDRPDKIRVIPDFVIDPKSPFTGGVFQIWEVIKGALHHPRVGELTLLALTHDLWVIHIPLRGRKKLFVPRNKSLTRDIREAMVRKHWEIGTY